MVTRRCKKKTCFYGLGGLLASLADFWGPKGSTQGPLGPPQHRQEWPGDPPVSYRTLPKNANLQKLQNEPQNEAFLEAPKAPKPFEFLMFPLKIGPRRGPQKEPELGSKMDPK